MDSEMNSASNVNAEKPSTSKEVSTFAAPSTPTSAGPPSSSDAQPSTSKATPVILNKSGSPIAISKVSDGDRPLVRVFRIHRLSPNAVAAKAYAAKVTAFDGEPRSKAKVSSAAASPSDKPSSKKEPSPKKGEPDKASSKTEPSPKKEESDKPSSKKEPSPKKGEPDKASSKTEPSPKKEESDKPSSKKEPSPKKEEPDKPSKKRRCIPKKKRRVLVRPPSRVARARILFADAKYTIVREAVMPEKVPAKVYYHLMGKSFINLKDILNKTINLKINSPSPCIPYRHKRRSSSGAGNFSKALDKPSKKAKKIII